MVRSKIFLILPVVLFVNAAAAQEFILLSDKYSCMKFANGNSTVVLNGATPGAYSIIGAGLALKDLRTEVRAANQKILRLNETREKVAAGEFTKQSSSIIRRFLDYYLPTESVKKKKNERLAQIGLIIQKVRAEIALLKSIDLAIENCAQAEKADKTSAKYGQRIPIVVKPVIVPGSAAFNKRESYVGMLMTVTQDVPINDNKGRKVGTRSGYLACAKNLSTNKTFYRIFDDQPCQESEGGINGGNTSLQFADLDACKALLPDKTWASFGAWQAVGGFPTDDQVNAAYANLLATVPPYFQVVFYDSDPIDFSGKGPSLDEFKSWCGSGAAF